MTQQVALLLHPGFNATSLGCILDAFFVANWQGGRTHYRWTLVSSSGGGIKSFSGLSVETVCLSSLSAREVAQVLVFSSFDPFSLAGGPGVSAFLREAYRFGARLAGVETGSIALADAGLLDGRQTALHWSNREGFEERYRAVQLSEQPVHRDGRFLSCEGGASALDLALMILEEDLGADLAQDVAVHLKSAKSSQGREPGMDPSTDPVIAAARRLMMATISEPLSLGAVAERLDITLRGLERRFAKILGRSPRSLYLDLRLTRAQNLLQQTTLPVGEIAIETGFESLPSFSRAYKARFRIAPSRDRRQTETATVPKVL